MHPLFGSILQQLGDLIMIMIVVGMALYGWQHGLFLATVAGLQVLGSFLAAMALADTLAPLLVQADCPQTYAFPVAFLLIFLGSTVVIRLGVGSGVREGDVRCSEWIDRIGGTLVGAIAGYVLAGAVLVAWSMAPLIDALQLKGAELKLDAGGPLLRTFGRCFDETDLSQRLLRCYESGNWDERFPAVAPAGDDEPVAEGAAQEGSAAQEAPAASAEPISQQP